MDTTRFAGADAGGTHTRVVVADGSGDGLSQATGGPGNLQRVGAEALASRIAALLSDCGVERVETLCVGAAGAGRPHDQEGLRQALSRRGLAESVVVVSDARAALEGAHGGRPGIVCIAGTGSMVLGRDDAGRDRRAGGWGPALGDDGSAHGLVMAGIRACLQAVDGSGPPTDLDAALLAELGLSEWQEIVAAVYGAGLTKERIASACPALFRAEAQGDDVARGIIDTELAALGAQVAAVGRHLGLPGPLAVAGTGGVFAEWERVTRGIAAGAGEVALDWSTPRWPAHLGALRLAMATAGCEPGDDVAAAWDDA
jgi:N-acetylmuramic acid 6-phosphate etherase